MTTPTPPRAAPPARPGPHPPRRPATPVPPAAAPSQDWYDHPAARHGFAFGLAFVLPALLRLLVGAGGSGVSGLAPLAVMLGFGALVVGLLLYAWWVHTAWRNRDAESWAHPWMFGEGPTAFSRHPGWLAVILIVLGQALIAGGWLAWLYTAALVLALDVWVRLHDEPAWMHGHPNEFAAYRERVPRWLPWSTLLRALKDLVSLVRNSLRSR